MPTSTDVAAEQGSSKKQPPESTDAVLGPGASKEEQPPESIVAAAKQGVLDEKQTPESTNITTEQEVSPKEQQPEPEADEPSEAESRDPVPSIQTAGSSEPQSEPQSEKQISSVTAPPADVPQRHTHNEGHTADDEAQRVASNNATSSYDGVEDKEAAVESARISMANKEAATAVGSMRPPDEDNDSEEEEAVATVESPPGTLGDGPSSASNPEVWAQQTLVEAAAAAAAPDAASCQSLPPSTVPIPARAGFSTLPPVPRLLGALPPLKGARAALPPLPSSAA